ncbi:MAG: oligosaccharide flippase family protein [Candidatus Nanopelagicales bacterium]
MRGREPGAPDPRENLGKLVRSGAMWSFASTMLLRAGQFLVGVIVARLIPPEQLGLMSVALIVHAIILAANDLGVAAAIVRTPGDIRPMLPTVNVIALGFSFLAGTAMYFAAPLLASALGAPEAAGAVRILSLTVYLGGISSVPVALLFRDFRQDTRFLSESLNFLASSTTVVWLVHAGWGAEGIAWSRVIGQVVGTLVYMYFARYVVRIGWDGRQARELFRFGLPLAGSSMVSLAVENIDYMVVSRLLGPTPLGYYTLAYNIAGWPPSLVNSVLASIVIPAVGRLAGHQPGLRHQLTRGATVLALLALPAAALLSTLAAPLIAIVYGQKWASAAAPLAVLAMLGPFRMATTFFSDVLIALGRTRVLLLVRLAWLGLLVPVLIVLVRWHGIVGAGMAQIAVSAVILPALVVILSVEGSVSPRAIARAVLPLAWPVAACTAAALAVSRQDLGPLATFLAGGVVGGMAYLAVLGLQFLRLRHARAGWLVVFRADPEASA